MCRNIRVLFNFEPPTTREEIEAAAVQYVRKVSGVQKPSAADQAAFDRAVRELTAVTDKLLASLTPKGPSRTREGEREKGKERWRKREAAMRSRF